MGLVTNNLCDVLTNGREVGSINGYQAYLNQIDQVPQISRAEERELFRRFQRDNDLNAARRIVLSHLRFVTYIAKSYRGYGLPIEDLVQEGNIGLMTAVKRFDLSYGVRLASFAIHWIKAEIHNYVIKNWRLVKVASTKAQRKLFFNLRKLKKSLAWLTEKETQHIAKMLDVPPQEVREMESRLTQKDSYFDQSFGEAHDDELDLQTASASDLEDNSCSPDMLVEEEKMAINTSRAIKEALTKFDDRSTDIIQSRWLSENKVGLKVLSLRYGVSIERIRQIEVEAMKKLSKILASLRPMLD